MQTTTSSNQPGMIKMPSYDIFNEQAMGLDPYKIFFAYFAKVPCKHRLVAVKGSQLRTYIEKELSSQIVEIIYSREGHARSKTKEFEEIVYVMQNEMMVKVKSGQCSLLYSHQRESLADAWLEQFKSFRLRKKRRKSISMIISTRRGLDTVDIHVKKPVINLSTHYNEGMKEIHKKLLATLNKHHHSGLVLFHGIPGTGKSTYIKHLIYLVRKEVIFLPPRIAAGMDSPDFTQFLVQHPNTIFVIEDAEELIVNDSAGRNSGMSMLLNLSDGLLGEGLGIQFIATFNTNVENIDPALLRKGRLNNLYEFKALDIPKAKALISKVAPINTPVNQPLTLAEIYHSDTESVEYKRPRSKIGFLQ